jgi:sporulation protein YlmC with PRC-barrel domain
VRGAQVIPANRGASFNYLTNWIGMRVADSTGKVVGVASDYILNLCESHVLYIILQPDPSLGIKNGSQVLIPLEIVTTAGGTLDAVQKAIFLPVRASEVANAPLVNAPVSLTDLSWEQGVQAYWGKFTRFSLSTQCGSYLPAGEGKPLTTPKIGLASHVLKATFQNEKKQSLGKVIEAVIIPDSGFIRYLAIQLDPSIENGIVLAPTGAMTIKGTDVNQEGSLITLIVGNASTLQAAPQVSSLPNPADKTWEDQSFAYWSQYVKMTK